jgi:hypothetical protein
MAHNHKSNTDRLLVYQRRASTVRELRRQLTDHLQASYRGDTPEDDRPPPTLRTGDEPFRPRQAMCHLLDADMREVNYPGYRALPLPLPRQAEIVFPQCGAGGRVCVKYLQIGDELLELNTETGHGEIISEGCSPRFYPRTITSYPPKENTVHHTMQSHDDFDEMSVWSTIEMLRTLSTIRSELR